MNTMLLLALAVVVAILCEARPSRPLRRAQAWILAVVAALAAGLGAVLALGGFV